MSHEEIDAIVNDTLLVIWLIFYIDGLYACADLGGAWVQDGIWYSCVETI